MNTDVKQQWLEALRSGQYKQGKGQLHRIEASGEATYCCLGVLCDLAVKAGVAEVVNQVNITSYDPLTYTDRVLDDLEVWYGVADPGVNGVSSAVLPNGVREWAGLADSDPIVRSFASESVNISTINDWGRDFEDIADIIEEQL